jgi:hypothetical protein
MPVRWLLSIQTIVRPTTAGHCRWWQTNPRVGRNPTRMLVVTRATRSYAASAAGAQVVVHLDIDACGLSTHRTGSRARPSGSPITTSGPRARSRCAAVIIPDAAARVVGDGSSGMLPPSNVTAGRSRRIWRVPQPYHSRHAADPRRLNHFPGVHPNRMRGTTAHPSLRAISRTAGSHMNACESPIRTMSFSLDVRPTRQTLLVAFALASWPMHAYGMRYLRGNNLIVASGGTSFAGMGAPRRAASTARATAGRTVDAGDVCSRSVAVLAVAADVAAIVSTLAMHRPAAPTAARARADDVFELPAGRRSRLLRRTEPTA